MHPPVGTEVQQGSIIWLGKLTEIEATQNQRGARFIPVKNAVTKEPAHSSFYNHPILVISRPDPKADRIFFLNERIFATLKEKHQLTPLLFQMTSFTERSLEQRFIGIKRHRWAVFLAMEPAEQHPLFVHGNQNYRTLKLDNGAILNKEGYLDVSQIWTMDWRDTLQYPSKRCDQGPGKQFKLDDESIQAVLSFLKRSIPINIDREAYLNAPGLLTEGASVIQYGTFIKAQLEQLEYEHRPPEEPLAVEETLPDGIDRKQLLAALLSPSIDLPEHIDNSSFRESAGLASDQEAGEAWRELKTTLVRMKKSLVAEVKAKEEAVQEMHVDLQTSPPAPAPQEPAKEQRAAHRNGNRRSIGRTLKLWARGSILGRLSVPWTR